MMVITILIKTRIRLLTNGSFALSTFDSIKECTMALIGRIRSSTIERLWTSSKVYKIIEEKMIMLYSEEK